jgi:hypothetical protein
MVGIRRALLMITPVNGYKTQKKSQAYLLFLMETFVPLRALRGEFSGNLCVLCGEIGLLVRNFFHHEGHEEHEGVGNTKERAGVSF